MRSKKAGKRLDKAEELLSNVIEQYAKNRPDMREFLDSAKDSVARAKAALKKASPENSEKSPVKVKKLKRRSPTTSRKKAPLVNSELVTSEKGPTVLKRKASAAETATAVSKTA